MRRVQETMIGPEDLREALPRVDGVVKLQGLGSSVEIYRDRFGIPHVRAATEQDAFFAQGFVTAQDRLWHMEYDRKRGAGRWAEMVGSPALEQDKTMRRFRLEASARADYEASGQRSRTMLDAYALGVNAFIETTATLPVEYRITGLSPEPWQPWDGLVIYKVRHILMGVFESKLWRAQVLEGVGPEKAALLFPGYQPGQLLILPPGMTYTGPLSDSLEELSQGVAALRHLNGSSGGSNSWVISGDRTASGKPLLAGDSHRALDTPNVYYQNHLSCPDFDVTGLSFPGVPGFPHFGHNKSVAWCVTHTGADYQDLYIEQFKEGDSSQYLFQGEWREAQVYSEVIKVKHGTDEYIQVSVTHHGPVISGDPEKGAALSFRYTATDGPSIWTETLWKMLQAEDCDGLIESMREWVDPCQNFLIADVHGNFGYFCRGRLPIRSMANAWLPVPGWTGEHEWQGDVPFEEMPRSMNPEQGYIATANNRPVGDDYPHYISLDFNPGFRARRVTDGLLALNRPTASDMAKVHAERVSIPAQAYVGFLKQVEPQDPLSALAKEKLLAWPGHMDAGRIEPTIYSAFRDALLKNLLIHNLGEDLADRAWDTDGRGLGMFMNRLKARLITVIAEDDRSLLPPGQDWPSMMSRALAKGVADLKQRLGDDLENWRWEKIHQAHPRHTLSDAYPELAGLLDPPPMPMNGDGDTPLAGTYSTADPFRVTSLSVARYAYDLADWDNSLWAVPLGASGHPGSPHYHDQSETWRQVQMVPMLYAWDRIIAQAESQQRLEPA